MEDESTTQKVRSALPLLKSTKVIIMMVFLICFVVLEGISIYFESEAEKDVNMVIFVKKIIGDRLLKLLPFKSNSTFIANQTLFDLPN